jgi:Spy/CpxP family protein refolding chaperone
MTVSDPSPRTIRLVTALLLIATFAAGTVTGGALVHWDSKREPPSHPMPDLGPLPWETLDLTEAQRKQAHSILERYRPKLDAIFDDTAPRVRAITDEIDKEFRKILTVEQQTRFDRILAARQGGPRSLSPPPPGVHLPGPFDGPPGPPPGAPFAVPPHEHSRSAPAQDASVP